MTTAPKSPWAHASEYSLSHSPAFLNNHHPRPSKHRPVRPTHNRSVSSNPSVSPLAKIKEEHKAAHRAKHLRKAVPADTIDSLDKSFFGNGTYHHEGPYDATLASRQIPGHSPIDAVKYTNAQALAATPRANIIDSLTRKVPLQGVGMVPPGVVGPGGQKFEYEEEDIQRSQGGLGRWSGIEYLDADIKGKGEPSFTIEEQEKALEAQRRSQKGVVYNGEGEMEMLHYGRMRSVSDLSQYPYRMSPVETSTSSGSGVLGELKKKLPLRRRK
ncbi:hypothetical protein L211DRAFT_608792 [Terfezia boudieri ATCC MYA-4762]|uniref:Pal1-domain-containing protein n=1 Tax=Terfezia boudieri ATCC MYA-4762 TaxID=1051890 RepID=A0A3N4LZL4_9PEZI|nr:hypothetical protein L211DRAFT_608792 [Terfezia boudieri ATCC MYA-4762]